MLLVKWPLELQVSISWLHFSRPSFFLIRKLHQLSLIFLLSKYSSSLAMSLGIGRSWVRWRQKTWPATLLEPSFPSTQRTTKDLVVRHGVWFAGSLWLDAARSGGFCVPRFSTTHFISHFFPNLSECLSE